MTIAEITLRAHDTGFEQGSMAAANAIIAFLRRKRMLNAAELVFEAWNEGQITEPEVSAPIPVAAAPAAPSASKLDRKQARLSGYTGDACTDCQSMQVKRNGACLVCEACGTTTGCS